MPNVTRRSDLAGDPSEPDLELRPMRESDLPEILGIERRAFPSPWKREHFLHEMRSNRWAVNRVVERGGRLVAYACLWYAEDELRINNIALRPELQGTGIGTWFLGRILSDAHDHGCRIAQLEVRPSNEVARRLYRRHGFKEIGRRRNYYSVEGEDAILMSRKLEGPA